jgi:hypothetical protein
MNKKDIINFIRLTDPVGEYFEELGGVYCYTTPSVIVILAEEQYRKPFLLTSDNRYINTVNNNIMKYVDDLNINGHADYKIPNMGDHKIITRLTDFNNNFLVFSTISRLFHHYLCNGIYPCDLNTYITVLPIRYVFIE